MIKPKTRLTSAILAGTVAIAVNIVLLYGGHFAHINTGHGGLLKLLAITFDFNPIPWGSGFLSLLNPSIWKYAFHFIIGLAMAVFYAYVIENTLNDQLPAAAKGLVYAAILWLANSAIILPLLGEGFAGYKSIPLFGIFYFAIAHTVFFVLLAIIYEKLWPRESMLTLNKLQIGGMR